MADSITLTVPFERPYQGVVRLVMGGLAARLDLPLEALEDLQLAVETLLSNEAYAAGDAVTIEVQVDGGSIALVVGPLEREALAADLYERAEAERGVGLGRLLGTVMGDYRLEERSGGGYLRMRKRLAGAESPA